MNEMEHLEQQLGKVDDKVSAILFLLKGNELDKDDKGMIGTQKDHSKRIANIEKLKERVIWFLFGLSIFAGWGLIDILQKILIKK